MKLGACTACLHDRPLPEALDVLKSNGLTSAEVNTGGFIPSPHCHLDLLLSPRAGPPEPGVGADANPARALGGAEGGGALEGGRAYAVEAKPSG